MKVICEVSFGNDDKVRVSVVTNMRQVSGKCFLEIKTKSFFNFSENFCDILLETLRDLLT